MLSSRIKKRVPSAKAVGRAALYDWCVEFSKKSKDGSGKANLFQKEGFVTWGSLYEISTDEISKLDNFEKGYTRLTVKVKKDNGETIEAEAYFSDNLADNQVAFESYKQMIISGALEQNLPAAYVQYLQQLPSRPKEAA